MKKNLVILFLVVVIIGFIYQGRKVAPSPAPQTSVFSNPNTVVSDSPAPSPVVSGVLQTSQVSKTQALVPATGNIDDEIKELQQQIKDSSVTSLDQQSKDIQNQISALKTQLQSYQNSESSIERSATTQLQFQQTLNRQKQEAITNRIRSLRRNIPLLLSELKDAQLNSDVNNPNAVSDLQHRIKARQSEIKDLMSQSEELSSDAIDTTSSLGDQLSYAKSNLEANRASLQSQINFLLDDLDRIGREKTRSQEMIAVLKQELNEKLNEKKSLQSP